jgi:hypothetical protein
MKRALITVTVLIQLLTAGAVLAVDVDFAALGGNSYGISGISAASGWSNISQDSNNYVTMWYDIGDPAFPVGFAQVDSAGVFGDSNGGPLEFDFNKLQTTLDIRFTMLGASSLINSAFAITFYENGNPFFSTTADATTPDINGDYFGLLNYNGSDFDKVTMFFDPSAPLFTVDSVSYSAVPEPALLTLVIVGLLGLGGHRICRRRRPALA